jgi:CBS domain-containing protein
VPDVRDYTAGKVDWLAAGLPTEGRGPDAPRVVSGIDRDVPTCGVGDGAGPAVQRAKEQGWSLCVVVNDDRMVVGRLRSDGISPSDGRRAEEAMEPGPATIRAHEDLSGALARMAERRVGVLLVTTPEGTLLGALRSPTMPPATGTAKLVTKPPPRG